MGLLKSTETAFGVTANYWKITELQYYAPGGGLNHPLGRRFEGGGFADVKLGLFLDKAAADAGSTAMASTSITVAVEMVSDDNLSTQIYGKAPTATETLAGAIDVLE